MFARETDGPGFDFHLKDSGCTLLRSSVLGLNAHPVSPGIRRVVLIRLVRNLNSLHNPIRIIYYFYHKTKIKHERI